MISKTELSNFLVTAKRNSYSSGDDSIKIKLDDKSTEIIYKENNFIYRDRYFGGEPFSGEEVVFYNNQPVWIMNFYGCVNEESLNLSEKIYSFLRKSLAEVNPSLPFRGPIEYSSSEFNYINIVEGSINHFVGREAILFNNIEVYHANYHGGFVDKK